MPADPLRQAGVEGSAEAHSKAYASGRYSEISARPLGRGTSPPESGAGPDGLSTRRPRPCATARLPGRARRARFAASWTIARAIRGVRRRRDDVERQRRATERAAAELARTSPLRDAAAGRGRRAIWWHGSLRKIAEANKHKEIAAAHVERCGRLLALLTHETCPPRSRRRAARAIAIAVTGAASVLDSALPGNLAIPDQPWTWAGAVLALAGLRARTAAPSSAHDTVASANTCWHTVFVERYIG